MKLFLTGAFVVISLFAVAAPEANAQSISGNVYYQVAGGNLFPAPSFIVKFCKADPNNNYALIPGACAQSNPTFQGFFGFNVRHGSGWYYMYLWRNDWFWGSETYPVAGPLFIATLPFGQQINGVSARPRALPPVAVNPPDNSVNRPVSFTLQWSDGLDFARRDPNWAVTYDIYASGNEFPENLVFSNIPCNGFGTCSVNVSGLAYSTRYQWRVVARMRSAVHFPQFGDNIFLTSSQTLRFSTMFDPGTPTYAFRASNGRYLVAPGGGGGDFVATASSPELNATFKIKDINGGLLTSGDSVNIQTHRNFYVIAQNGGGADVNADSKWTMSWETFTIEKVGGTGVIGSGDRIAFKGPNGVHYMMAVNGGGGSVSCTGPGIGTWETFTLIQQ